MISLPKLDDQNYAEIVEAAKRRIPVIFPEWTDFNEHDPGITVIELFAWLKEMQQYTLDRIPDSTREAMLRLAGVQPLEAAPAAVELIPAAPPEFLPAGSTAHSADGTEFTLTEPFRRQDAQISNQTAAHLSGPEGRTLHAALIVHTSRRFTEQTLTAGRIRARARKQPVVQLDHFLYSPIY